MKQRIITAIVGIIIILPIILYGSWPFYLTVFFLAAVGLYELYRMFSMKSYLGYSLSLLVLWSLIYVLDKGVLLKQIDALTIILSYLVSLLVVTVLTKNKFTMTMASQLVFALLYIAFSFQYMIEVRAIGLHVFLFILFTIWATDSGAYFIGKKFGQKKLWPEISPNKTIGGALGGILFAMVLAILFYILAPFEQSLWSLLIMAVFISIFGQIGDLVASAMKRNFHMKDFGHIFPGHGGVLDRLDSFIFVLLMLQMVQYF